MPSQLAWFHRLDEKWLQPAGGGEQVWGCAICRWPSPGPVGSDTGLAAERSSRLAASVTRSCSGRQRAANWLRCMIESIDKLETMPALFAVRGVRGGRKIRAKPGEAYAADGQTRHRPFHSYTMKQAIQEGFILDVLRYYTPVELASSRSRPSPCVQNGPGGAGSMVVNSSGRLVPQSPLAGPRLGAA